MTRPYLLGIPADPITFNQLLDHIEMWIQSNDGLHQICTINPEFTVIAQSDYDFFTLLQRSNLNVIDGWGAVMALRGRGISVPERVTGSDGVPMIAQRAAQQGWRLFLLGAAEGIADETAIILQNRYPDLQIAGTYSGSPHPDDADHIIQMINDSQADILFVAYGAPKQDLWIDRYRDRLAVNVAMGIGGSFDFITGNVPRAPQWMRQSGLEWLYRLYLQPSRWRRMLRLPIFVMWVLIFGSRSPKWSTNHDHN